MAGAESSLASNNEAAKMLKKFGNDVYVISKKVQGLQQAQAKLGTWQDTAELRSSLTQRAAALKAAFAEATATCRAASSVILAPSADASPFRAANLGTLQRLERDLVESCDQYRQVADGLVARFGASRPRSPRKPPQETPMTDVAPRSGALSDQSRQQQEQSQLTAPLLTEQVHDLRDEIEDRDQGIAEVVLSVMEVRQDMQDINELLHHQDPLIQHLAVNVQDTDQRIEAGYNQVRIASSRTKKFLSCWNILVIVVGATIGLILALNFM